MTGTKTLYPSDNLQYESNDYLSRCNASSSSICWTRKSFRSFVFSLLAVAVSRTLQRQRWQNRWLRKVAFLAIRALVWMREWKGKQFSELSTLCKNCYTQRFDWRYSRIIYWIISFTARQTDEADEFSRSVHKEKAIDTITKKGIQEMVRNSFLRFGFPSSRNRRAKKTQFIYIPVPVVRRDRLKLCLSYRFNSTWKVRCQQLE